LLYWRHWRETMSESMDRLRERLSEAVDEADGATQIVAAVLDKGAYAVNNTGLRAALRVASDALAALSRAALSVKWEIPAEPIRAGYEAMCGALDHLHAEGIIEHDAASVCDGSYLETKASDEAEG